MAASSPFASKLGTNYCPPDAELAQINELLIEPCQRLTRLDGEIATMRKAIDKLAEERDAINFYVEAHRALASPIRRLPLDIIEEIFMACLPSSRNCVMSAKEAPVILGRICSSWRAITFSTPRLWASLHIVEPTRPYTSAVGIFEAKVAQRLEVAHTWLARSATCPLSISIQCNHDTTPPSPNTRLFLNVITPFASRWRNIRLVVPPKALETFLPLTEDDVPLLKNMKIVERPAHPNDSIEGTGWRLSQARILNCPSLTKFSLSGSDSSAELPLRWNQLINLTLMGPGWGMGEIQTCDVVLDILSKCPNLRTCKLLVQGPPEGHLTDSSVECPFLHTLDLYCGLHTAGRLLSRLSLPDLRHLRLGGHGDLRVFSVAPLVSSLAAATHLESISIESQTFSKASLMDFLRGLSPTIRRLRIMDQYDPWHPGPDAALDDDVLAALSVSPDGSALCPALQELVVDHCRKVTDDALRRFILSRTPQLTRVDVKFDREMQTDIRPSIQPLVDAGLQTNITYVVLPPLPFSPWLGLPDAPPPGWIVSPAVS
ncbi:hypothetical protein C8R47DRAFT_91072 [Mycena vitilis]|nr:hypothetical protein C8R47DRAFT_91072 [Mycena vitilis]